MPPTIATCACSRAGSTGATGACTARRRCIWGAPNWGDHRHLAGHVPGGWEDNKIGGGAQMIETDRGWLQIYHGVDAGQRYRLGALLLDLDDPRIVRARLAQPLAEPVEPYERSGFFDNVVFSCGALVEGETLRVYYGAADRVMALGTVALPDLWQAMGG